jgi:LPS-assembly protein
MVEDYDYVQHTLLYQFGQLSYNTNCCGFSFQYRRFSFGTGIGARHENQFLLAFQVANLGSFGTMQKQDRIF